jgi:hypothetical protein
MLHLNDAVLRPTGVSRGTETNSQETHRRPLREPTYYSLYVRPVTKYYASDLICLWIGLAVYKKPSLQKVVTK